MDKVNEIKVATDSLPPEELSRLTEWFRESQQRRWDQQLDCDSV